MLPKKYTSVEEKFRHTPTNSAARDSDHTFESLRAEEYFRHPKKRLPPRFRTRSVNRHKKRLPPEIQSQVRTSDTKKRLPPEMQRHVREDISEKKTFQNSYER